MLIIVLALTINNSEQYIHIYLYIHIYTNVYTYSLGVANFEGPFSGEPRWSQGWGFEHRPNMRVRACKHFELQHNQARQKQGVANLDGHVNT